MMFYTLRRVVISMSWCLLLVAGLAAVSLAMGTAFTYQGQLKGTGGAPVTANCDLTFALYDALSGGAQVGTTVTKSGIAVTSGLFTTSLDFGSAVFDGSDRWLQITAKCGSDATATTLSPRQALTPAPYALYAANGGGSGGGVFENSGGVVRNTGTHATDDFVFGSPQLADASGTDDDARLFLDKSKGAFRAGYVNGTQWDDASVGNYSFAAGYGTTASGEYATVGGGVGNTASGDAATVGGGYLNTASDLAAAIAGGYMNTASGYYAAVAGGGGNTASGLQSTVAGGQTNNASGEKATVAGGMHNTASHLAATVGGGHTNEASGDYATVAGGGDNTASGSYAAVAGGMNNIAAGDYSFAAGRRAKINAAHAGAFLFADSTDADFASAAANEFAVRATGGVRFVADGGLVAQGTFGAGAIPATGAGTRLMWYPKKAAFRAGKVDGTQWDDASVGNYSFAAGYNNTASSDYATVGGGKSNTTSGDFASYATVAGGDSNTASGHAATVAGGYSNTASGDYAAVAGGYSNTAAGYYSFAAGYRAKIGDGHDGTFLFADSTEADFASAAMNEFAVRARGGVRFADGGGTNKFTFNTSTGVGTATTWATTSDRNAKEHFAPVNPQEVLAKVAALPIHTWNYKTQDASIRHIGPVAQDFRAAFGLGENDTTISTVDPDGVALAAIQGLYRMVQARDAAIAALKAEIVVLKQQQAQQTAQQATIDLLLQRLTALEQTMHTPVVQADVQH